MQRGPEDLREGPLGSYWVRSFGRGSVPLKRRQKGGQKGYVERADEAIQERARLRAKPRSHSNILALECHSAVASCFTDIAGRESGLFLKHDL